MNYKDCESCIHNNVCKKKENFKACFEILALHKAVQDLQNDGFEFTVNCKNYYEEKPKEKVVGVKTIEEEK